MTIQLIKTLTRKDFVSNQEPRWCPACGDYAILATVQRVLPELGIPKERFVWVSGIGCSSRFPYYLDTFGLHTIHGRALPIATGIRVANPDLSVWVATGDGDAMSIGGNHLLHCLRRNVGLKILLFNNRIYGLTKGQYSPTSELGKVTKTSPGGVIDYPVEPVAFALGCGATFVARSYDTAGEHLAHVLRRAAAHRGTAFVEILQNCVVFNNGAFAAFTERDNVEERQLRVEHGKPLLYGKGRQRGLCLDPSTLSLAPVDLQQTPEREKDVLVFDETNPLAATLLSHLAGPSQPLPLGVLHESSSRATYEDGLLSAQPTREPSSAVRMNALFRSGNTWQVP